MAERIQSATTVMVRVRLELPQKVDGRNIEAEIRYDFASPTRCRVESTALQPKVPRKDPG